MRTHAHHLVSFYCCHRNDHANRVIPYFDIHVPQMYRDGGERYITSILILTEIYIILFYCQNREWTLLRWYFYFWKIVTYNETCIGGSRKGGGLREWKEKRKNSESVERLFNLCVCALLLRNTISIKYFKNISLQPPPLKNFWTRAWTCNTVFQIFYRNVY